MGCHFCHSRNRHLWGNLRNTGDSEYVMNVQVLISAVVRQVTVLIAQLATSGGARAPLAQVANQVFLELAAELENQGVGRKVSADMFGMANSGASMRCNISAKFETAAPKKITGKKPVSASTKTQASVTK